MRTVYMVISFSFIFFQGFSQTNYTDLNAVALPAVNNKIFVSNTDYDVNLYSGTPLINVPVYSLPSKELAIPISLSYIGGKGLRVQDVANFVGLGWQLNTGRITRIVRGLPDEHTNGYIGTSKYGNTIKVAGPSGLTTDIFNKVGNGLFDGEADLFSISTPFFNFQFSFDEMGIPVFPKYNGYKIVHNLYNNSSPSNTSFTVIDDLGNQYFFGSSSNSRENETTTLYTNSTSFTGVWYLDKIVSYNGSDQIVFNYVSGSDYSVDHVSSSSTTFNTSPTCSVGNIAPFNITQTTTFNSPKYISSIVSRLGEVDFSYIWDRRDITNGARLSSISIYPLNTMTLAKGALLKTFQFKYSYFGDVVGAVQNQLRLRLDSISLTGNPSVLPTINLQYKGFEYNTTNNLPARNSLEFDHWGYYNVNSTGTSLPPVANKAPDFTRTIANVLTAVIDMSGAKDQFQYELNTYYDAISNTSLNTGGLRIKKITKTNTQGANLSTDYIYTDENNKSTGQINNSNFSKYSKVINLLVTSPTTCGISGTNTSSESVYSSNDLNGVFVGYSSVKVKYPNSGWEVVRFTNFSDFPDSYIYNTSDNQTYAFSNSRQLSTPTSLAYKRGLVLNKTVYDEAGNKVTEVQNTYSAQTAVQSKALSLKVLPLTYILGGNITVWVYGIYYTNLENYVLSSTKEFSYDQKTGASQNNLQKTTSYTYILDNNLYRSIQIKSIATTDSKGLPYTKTLFHAFESSIPMVTTGEQTAISEMLKANRSTPIIHDIEDRNGVLKQSHNSLVVYPINSNYSGAAKVFLGSSSFFNNTNLASQRFFNYDGINGSQISTYLLNGKASATAFSYNNSLPDVAVQNAASSINYQAGSTMGTLNILPNNFGIQTISFQTNFVGSITLAMPSGSYLSGGATCFFSYTLNGPAYRTGYLCNNSKVGYTCSDPNSVTFTNMPIGSYTLSVTPNTNSATLTVPVNYTYPISQAVPTKEYYFEGFEQNNSAISGIAHTGGYYLNGNFSVPFTKPNTKTYLIQYWSLIGGIWSFNETQYSNGMVLTGPVDDIRVFPKDALMSTYTFSPLVGITSQTDPSGKSTSFIYDGLGRIKTILDQDKNVLKEYEYQYQRLIVPVYNSVQTLSYQKTNCPVGYTGLFIPLTVAANTYSSYIDLQDANRQAINYLNTTGPANANSQSTGTACQINPTPTVNGQTSFNINQPSGSGSVSGIPGSIIKVTINAGGQTTNGYTISATIKNGTTTIGSGSVTSNTLTFNFVLPASGTANWTVVFTGSNSYGSGTISFSY